VQFELRFESPQSKRPISSEDWLRVGTRLVRLRLVRNRRARRYVLRLSRDGSARVAIPRGGSPAEAKRFAQQNATWLETQLLRYANPRLPQLWRVGTEVLFRGEPVRLELALSGERGIVTFADQVVSVKDPAADLRNEVELHLRRLAAREFPPRHNLSQLAPGPDSSFCD
jgi:predicted metal-dependent hydrolase